MRPLSVRRRIAGAKELLGAATRTGTVQVTLTVRVPRRAGQPERSATGRALRHLRLATTQHPSPSQGLVAAALRTVLVEEVDPPAGVQPLQWLLLTMLPSACFADAEQVVRWYTYRWRIERYPFTLKSGCRLEDLQLETAGRLRRALASFRAAGVNTAGRPLSGDARRCLRPVAGTRSEPQESLETMYRKGRCGRAGAERNRPSFNLADVIPYRPGRQSLWQSQGAWAANTRRQ